MISRQEQNELTRFLEQDVSKGDITSKITPSMECVGEIKANENCVLAGIEEIVWLFNSKGLKINVFAKDGKKVKKGQKIVSVKGKNQKMLECERVALNLLGRMSGVATICAEAKAISKTKVAVTRKTIPGFQWLDKKAAEIGGAWSHRKNLNEMILLKENHLKFFNSTKEAIVKAKKTRGKKVEVEVETFEQAIEAASENPYMIMLDNFSSKEAGKTIKELRKTGYKNKIELSGGINLKNLEKYSDLDADIISMGALTKNAKIVDFNMNIEKAKK